jgi:hypothetical protein
MEGIGTQTPWEPDRLRRGPSAVHGSLERTSGELRELATDQGPSAGDRTERAHDEVQGG